MPRLYTSRQSDLAPHYFYSFTGNPFVDGGIATLCALSGKERPEDLTLSDLHRATKFVIDLYPRWVKLGNLFTRNCAVLNPAIKDKAGRYNTYLTELLSGVKPASEAGNCAGCGRREADRLLQRHEFPLAGSGDLVNYFSFFEQGHPMCSVCTFALQFLPLYAYGSRGLIFVAHTHRPEMLLEIARRSVNHIRGQLAGRGRPGFFSPFTDGNRYRVLIELVRKLIADEETLYGATSIRLYTIVNSGQRNRLEITDLPGEVFSFIEEVHAKGLSSSLNELLFTSPRSIYQNLVEGESLIWNFIRTREKRLIGGSPLFELYLVKVAEMDQNRLEALKKIGINLFEYLKSSKDFKKALQDFEGADNYTQFRLAMTRAQKSRL